jgi:beta-glucanase (GH16 family)
VRPAWWRLLAVTLAIAAPTSSLGCAPPPIAGGGYELVFRDEFDDGVVGGLWATAAFGGSLPPSEADGRMTIRTTAENAHQWGYVASTGPRVGTEPSYPFAQSWRRGYFEARIRFTETHWIWPAFWLFSMAKSEAWPGEDCRFLNAEWDIMEAGIGNLDGTRPATSSTYSVIHRNTTDGTGDGYCGIPDETRFFRTEDPGGDLADWHVWAGRWTDDELCTYLDQQLLGCLDPYDSTDQPMHLVFTVLYRAECLGCSERPPVLQMHIDWVRVWQ